ncbi:hypothetical protein BP5796_07844 [Coleophoma crateriformis]|uniref:Uncharacterized protein n=1 Tax=Coleophoma crateriformis TaxID=565419 RepID=A0A3D8RCW0_9HELO|nr:hypothetical protein BP5796_07844 [Coleophoma crateriformis]
MPLQFPKPEEPTGANTTDTPAEDNTSLPPTTNPSTGAKTAEQEEADRLYEERIEEEYAKRHDNQYYSTHKSTYVFPASWCIAVQDSLHLNIIVLMKRFKRPIASLRRDLFSLWLALDYNLPSLSSQQMAIDSEPR